MGYNAAQPYGSLLGSVIYWIQWNLRPSKHTWHCSLGEGPEAVAKTDKVLLRPLEIKMEHL